MPQNTNNIGVDDDDDHDDNDDDNSGGCIGGGGGGHNDELPFGFITLFNLNMRERILIYTQTKRKRDRQTQNKQRTEKFSNKTENDTHIRNSTKRKPNKYAVN